MDRSYILFNTIIYGVLATALAAFMAYGKFLNLAIASYFVLGGYVVYQLGTFGFGRGFIGITLVLITIFFGIHILLLHLFPHEKQRDLAAIVVTLMTAYFIDNLLAYIYGPGPINFSEIVISPRTLFVILIALIVIFYYFFSQAASAIMLKAIFEKTQIVRSLGLPVNQILQGVFAFFLLLLIAAAFLFLTKSAIKPSDGIFFLLKAIGIMILVGIGKKEYMFIGALLYVLLEYLLFIQRGLPIAYKETLVLVIILAVLICKPEGLFSLHKRRI